MTPISSDVTTGSDAAGLRAVRRPGDGGHFGPLVRSESSDPELPATLHYGSYFTGVDWQAD